MSEAELVPIEPDLVGIWRKNVWWFGLRIPFSLELVSWATMTAALAPEFHLDRYLLILLAGFFGLIMGAHYIDITSSKEKYLPYFPNMNRKAIRTVGILTVLLGLAVGVYMSLQYSPWFLVFVILGGFFALAYPVEKPKWLHSYPGFVDLVGIALAVFLAILVTEMHHLAVLTNEKEYGRETVQSARFLLKLHRGAAYAVGLVLLLARLI